jgi:hypothetical protein
VDDQAEWLDNERVLYALPRGNGNESDIWSSSINGGSPQVFIPNASSPAVVR